MTMTIGSLFAGIGGFDLGFERAGFKTVWQCEIDKAAQGVLRKHFLGAALHSDVREVGANNLAPVDVLTFGSPCFPAGVLVLTRRGLVAIEEVVIGDEVVSHLGRWQPVVRVGSKVAPTIRLKGQGHPGLVTTEEHPFWASSVGRKWNNDLRQYRREFGPLEWTPAKDMKGRMWSSLTEFPPAVVPPMVMDKWETSCPAITPELMWIVGSWVGDGWVRDAKRAGREDSHWGNVLIADGKGAPADEVRRRLKAANLTFGENDERTTTRFVVSSAPFARWLTTHFGRYAEGKTIPAWLLGAPLEMREAFLQGYLFADGSKLKDKGYRMTSVSKRLTFGIAMLIRCTRPSESVSIYWTAPNEGRQIEGRIIKEQASWQAQVCHEARSSLLIDDYRMGLVRECAPTGNEERVYNIEVEGDHSYTADGIIVHNCQDLSVAGKRAGLSGERSGLFHEAARVIRELRAAYGKPDFAIWENVPGAFSSNEGKDFAAVVQAMVNLGARDIAWRVLDSRYFGVAQRRRRVFLVADFGGERAEQILFEPESLRGDTPPRRKARKEAARGAGSCVAGGSYWDGGQLADTLDASMAARRQTMPERRRFAAVLEPVLATMDSVAGPLDSSYYKGQGSRQGGEREFVAVVEPVAFDTTQITSPSNYSSPKAGDPCHPLAAGAHPPAVAIQLNGDRDNPGVSVSDGVAFCLPANPMSDRAQAVAFAQNTRDEVRLMNGDGQIVGALAAQPGMKQTTYVAQPVTFHPTQDPISSQDGVSHAMSNGSKNGQPTVAVAVGFDATAPTANAMVERHPVLRGVSGGNAGHHTGVAVCATGEITHALTRRADSSEDGTGRGTPIISVPAVSGTLGGGSNTRGWSKDLDRSGAFIPTAAMQVRRLMPTEAESLQAFPRNWTAEIITPDGTVKQQADGPRYKQLGNAVTVNVAEWIARRVAAVLK